MKIEFLDEAKLEIRAGRERYNAERPALGRAFIHQIGAGPLHFQKVARSRAIAHQHQRPNYWRSRT